MINVHVGALYEYYKALAREARYCQLRKELAMDVCDMLDNIDRLERATGLSEGDYDAPTMEETKTYLMPFTTVPTPSTMLLRLGGLIV